jgi:hypothetical protein
MVFPDLTRFVLGFLHNSLAFPGRVRLLRWINIRLQHYSNGDAYVAPMEEWRVVPPPPDAVLRKDYSHYIVLGGVTVIPCQF